MRYEKKKREMEKNDPPSRKKEAIETDPKRNQMLYLTNKDSIVVFVNISQRY